MGRISKRHLMGRKSDAGLLSGGRTEKRGRCFRAGIYARLSADPVKKVRGQILETKCKVLQGENRGQQGESEAKVLQVENRGQQGESEAKVLQGENRALQGEAKVKQGEAKVLQGENKVLQGESRAVQIESRILQGESLEAQIEIAKRFVEEWNRSSKDRIEVAGCYTDIGKTGTNFNRDGFRRLMEDVRLGNINCVIVKDLSRLGRNYLETGNYIEKIFPFLGVRFIAVADGYDTGADGSDEKHLISEIKNLVNDMYAKDFSLKARASLAQRRRAGAYVGGPAPYGYKAEWNGRVRRLVPDEDTADIVRYVYEKFIETESYTAVSDALNIRRINPPMVYHRTGVVYCPPEADFKRWNKGAVERIIKSDTYLGKLVQGKTSITARDERNRIHRPEDEWVIKEEAHEPLIGSRTAEKAAGVRSKLQKRRRRNER